MPVTKTAKRALRSSAKKANINTLILTKLDVAMREAKKSKTSEKILKAISLADRAAKKNVFHKNKASRIKKALSKLLPAKTSKPKVSKVKTTKVKKSKK